MVFCEINGCLAKILLSSDGLDVSPSFWLYYVKFLKKRKIILREEVVLNSA